MACYLTAPSHYLNQCWLFINEVRWHSDESNFTASAQVTTLYYEFENYTFKITATASRGQFFKDLKWLVCNKQVSRAWISNCNLQYLWNVTTINALNTYIIPHINHVLERPNKATGKDRVEIRGFCHWQRIIEVRTWISNHIHDFPWDVILSCPDFQLDVIILLCPNFDGNLDKPPLKLGHEWVITYYNFMRM